MPDIYKCYDCNQIIEEDNEYVCYASSRLCITCYEDNYFTCDSCSEIYTNDDYDSDGYCYGCNENRDDDDYSIIKSYSYKPIPKFLKTSLEKTKLYYGIELEIERNKSKIAQSKLAEKIQNSNWYFKTDGSLNNGFEIVTEPMTYNFIEKNKNEFLDLLETIKKNKYLSYNKRTCGMHIHMSKNCFGTWQLYRFMKFFAENKEFVTKISQRKEDDLNRWASVESSDSKTLLKKAVKKEPLDSRRYVAINLMNSNTIELRLFRGTLNPNSFFKNIEFSDSMFYFTRDNKNIELNRYIDYIMKSKYKNLKQFIIDKNLI